MDRKKLLLGVFSAGEVLFTDRGVRDILEIGADYLVSVSADPGMLALCEKYRLPVLVSGRTPFWWGGDGGNAGGYHAVMTPAMTEAIAGEHPDSPVIAGDYLADEPNSRDFAGINAVMAAYRRLYPGKIPFINLYPGYGALAETTPDQRVCQLGNSTYREYIAQYLREVDADYLCLDYYPFTGACMDGYLNDLAVCADACRESGRELWVIFQAGARKKDEELLFSQVRFQGYMALAFGARSLQAACYQPAWWDPQCACVNEKGEKNAMYGYVQRVYRELHGLAEAYRQYRHAGNFRMGLPQDACPGLGKDFAALTACPLPGMSADGPVVAGRFEKENGAALMLVNAGNPADCSAGVTVTLRPAGDAVVWREGRAVRFSACPEGIRLPLSCGEGLFVEL